MSARKARSGVAKDALLNKVVEPLRGSSAGHRALR